jgi:hypothetical protein
MIYIYMYMPKRYWHFADQQLAIENTGNLINVGPKTIFLKEISKRFIIHHHSNTIKERILLCITVYIYQM